MQQSFDLSAPDTKSTPPPGPLSRLWSVSDVSAFTQLHRVTIYRLVRAGRFPAPLSVGRNIRWREDEILNWENGLHHRRY
ncbi:helix-turn-helix transcriptional regulator [Sphingorhabdus buctiana]|uniref:Helix-turn-helix transcriptional regulator n=1 Tax=Sphingorhabdus buctiana TaxID=1508805 RepID=A0ABW4MHU8_9SPHN